MAYSTETERAKRFVAEYLIDRNATAAATRAGYSATRAKHTGHELLQHPKIVEMIAAAEAKRATRTGIEADRVLEELGIIAFSDLDHYTIDTNTGTVILAEGAPKTAKRAIAAVKYRFNVKTQERTVELKFWDKNTAIGNAMKHLGILNESMELKLPPGAGVLAVPVPVGTEQWMAMATAQQAKLLDRPGAAAPTGP